VAIVRIGETWASSHTCKPSRGCAVAGLPASTAELPLRMKTRREKLRFIKAVGVPMPVIEQAVCQIFFKSY
jgi:hypothetical protein